MDFNKILFYYFIILLFSSEVLSESSNEDFNKISNYISKEKFFKENLNNKSNLFSELNKLISSNLSEDKIKDDFSFNIESNLFFIKDNKNIYTGNVILNYKDANLNCDYLEYDINNKILIIKDNIIFSKNDEFFKADLIKYDQKNKIGKIINIYGIISFDNLHTNYFSNNNDKNISKNEINNISLQSKNSFNFERTLENDQNFGISKFGIDLTKIDKWRFQSDKIELFEKEAISKRMVLSNDPLNPAQIKIILKNFKARKEKKSINYSSKWNNLIIEDKITIPLGSKSITDKKSKTTWSAGYDKDLNDGFFITRKYSPKKIGDNLEFNISNDFLLQRAFKGKSESYPINSSDINDIEVKTKANIYDFFGINSKLNGELSDLDIDIDSNLNSLNFDRFPRNFKTKGIISKKINFSNIKDINLGIYGSYRENVWNINSGKFELLSSYGLQGTKIKSFEKNGINKYYSGGISFGKYKGKAKPISNIKERWRTSLYARKQLIYPLLKFNETNNKLNNYKFKPQKLNTGIKFLTDLRIYSTFYNNDSNQNILYFSMGPKLSFGQLNKYFLDFTEISLIGEQIYRKGESPFYFDHWPKYATRLSIDLEQQLIGAISAGVKTYYYLENSDSSPKDDFFNTEFRIAWNRRAYNAELYYNQYTKVGGIKFSIFGLDYTNKDLPIYNFN
mgnify:CR=1 FL=1